MSRTRYNLNLATIDKFTLLIHGGYGAGKTHFGGDMLHTEQALGKVCYINIAGEDGSASLAAMGLGDIGESVDTYKDLSDLRNELRLKPIRALVLDSAIAASRLMARYVTGSDRPLKITRELNEYGPYNWEMWNFFTSLKGCADIAMVLCPSDKSVDQLTGRTLWTPDLSGRNAVGSAGWFDFVFILTAEALPNRVKRVLKTEIQPDAVIRLRAPRPLPKEVEIPDGGGGWAKVKAAIQSAFKV